MLIKKKRVCENIDMSLYKRIVTEYLEYMYTLHINPECKDVCEILRYSLCKVLNLATECSVSGYDEVIKGVINVLTPLVPEEVLTKKEDFRAGVLEACVHCIEFTRERVESNV